MTSVSDADDTSDVQFKKDVKRTRKRGKDFAELKRVVQLLAEGTPLDEKHRGHALGGNRGGTRDCHIEPDWLLLYLIDDEELVLVRTGSHADLFRN